MVAGRLPLPGEACQFAAQPRATYFVTSSTLVTASGSPSSSGLPLSSLSALLDAGRREVES